VLSYKEFRTGLSFKDVRRILKKESERKLKHNEYMFITRHTVLGRWHQIKKQMYKEYQSIMEL